MKRILSVLVFLSFSLCASMVVMAQDFPSLREKAEKIVKSKNPHWKLVRKEERGKQVNYLFGPEKADVVLTVFYGASEQEAADRMKAVFKFLSVGPGKQRSILVTKPSSGRPKPPVLPVSASGKLTFISI